MRLSGFSSYPVATFGKYSHFPAEFSKINIICSAGFAVNRYQIPDNMLPDKDNIKVVCVIDGKLIVLETNVVFIEGIYCIQFTATHFSPYAMVVDTENSLSNNPKTSETSPVIPYAFFQFQH